MKKPNLDNILVVDIECTCPDSSGEKDFPYEVIEVGLAVLNVGHGKIENSFSLLVRPEITKPGKFCTDLTGIVWETIKSSPPLLGVCNKLIKEHGAKNKIWASWGTSDLLHMQKECAEKQITYPFSPYHIDISTLFHIFSGFGNCHKRFSVMRAAKSLNISDGLVAHSGKDDAIAAAKILSYLMKGYRSSPAFDNKITIL